MEKSPPISHALDASKDLRSASKAFGRDRNQRDKYWGYRHIKRGQLNQPHYSSSAYEKQTDNSPFFPRFPADLSDCPTEILTKRKFYEEAQRWPKPPRYHSGRGKRRDGWFKHAHTSKREKRIRSETNTKKEIRDTATGKGDEHAVGMSIWDHLQCWGCIMEECGLATILGASEYCWDEEFYGGDEDGKVEGQETAIDEPSQSEDCCDKKPVMEDSYYIDEGYEWIEKDGSGPGIASKTCTIQ